MHHCVTGAPQLSIGSAQALPSHLLPYTGIGVIIRALMLMQAFAAQPQIRAGQTRAGWKPMDDPKMIVTSGYDRCARAYMTARAKDPSPELTLLAERITAPARILDVGCGAGLPVTAALARIATVVGAGNIARLRSPWLHENGFLCGAATERTFIEPSAKGSKRSQALVDSVRCDRPVPTRIVTLGAAEHALPVQEVERRTKTDCSNCRRRFLFQGWLSLPRERF